MLTSGLWSVVVACVLGWTSSSVLAAAGPHFWEHVQFRHPHPDRLHGVIPGQRFDGLVEDNNRNPGRRARA